MGFRRGGIMDFNELLKGKNKYEIFLSWLLKQQHYILPPDIKQVIKNLLEED